MLLTCLMSAVLAAALPAAVGEVSGPQPVRFLENLQRDAVHPAAGEGAAAAGSPVRFTARNGAVEAFVTDRSLVLLLSQGDEAVALHLGFEGADSGAAVRGEHSDGGMVNSYRGATADTWVEGASNFTTLRWRGLYEGVDVRLLERDGRLAYDLLLEAGADLEQVVLQCDGAQRLELVAPDRLLVHTELGPLEQSLPAAWEVDAAGQELPVQASFRLLDDTHFGFSVEGRHPERALVIDPGLNYGTYVGGSLLDSPSGVAFAPDGDLILVGTTGSSNFPTSPGAQQGMRAGNNDAFVARIDATDGSLVYATFFGGADTTTFDPEGARDVAVSADGSVTVVGRADSAGFPRTANTVGVVDPGGANGFVARFDASGALVWSTLVGGSNQDYATSVEVDSQGRSIVAGVTFSNNFPVTAGAYDESFNSIFFTNDLFVVSLSADASSFEYATYVGGSLRDEALDVALDSDGSAVVAGLTGSPDFPSTPGAYDESFNGDIPSETDAFVLRISPGGAVLEWCSFLGGLMIVEGRAVDLDDAGNAVLTGMTVGDDFPTTPGAFQDAFGGGGSDAFLSKLSADGSSLLWSSFLGGEGDEQGMDVVLTNGGLPTVVGSTNSQDFPTLGAAPIQTSGVPGGSTGVSPGTAATSGVPAPNPVSSPPAAGGSVTPTHDNSLNGGEDAFLVRTTFGGTTLLYATLHGGSADDAGVALDVNGFGSALMGGASTSLDLPTPGASFDSTANGAGDSFLARWSLPPFEYLPLSTGALGGAGGPTLRPHGSLEKGRPFSLVLDSAPARRDGFLLISRTASDIPLAGGTLMAWPAQALLPLRTDARGALTLKLERWPADLPSGAQLVLQVWLEPGERGALPVSSNGLALQVP